MSRTRAGESLKRSPSSPLAQRSSGVLLHVTSLPTPYGIGDLGPSAYQWVEMLAGARQRWWQVLPLGPVGAGHSPYQCYSAFAGNPLLISPDLLVRDGLLAQGDLTSARFTPSGPVNYTRVGRAKLQLLTLAWERLATAPKLAKAFDAFLNDPAHAHWLKDYAIFAALQEAHADRPDWTLWPTPIMRRRHDAMAEAWRTLGDKIGRHAFWQFLFDRQLRGLREHARAHRVGLIGDLPIFVSANSADVWAKPHLFELDRSLRPTAVAGVPPDMFSATGQRWGNPLYNWSRVAADDNFGWWRARFRASLAQCDLVRLDHFRGFEAYWRIPARNPTAVGGKWVKAPGEALLTALRDDVGSLPVIAEDLGVITPPVERLRDDFNLPGMRVLQFGFGGDANNPHLPHNFVRHCAAYTGTHDNDTTAGWHKSASREERQNLLRYAVTDGHDAAYALIRLAWTSVASLAVTPVQDLLSLPRQARMNTPGTERGNWQWRLSDFDALEPALEWLGELTRVSGRA